MFFDIYNIFLYNYHEEINMGNELYKKEYDGPKLNRIKLFKKFSKNLQANNGFIKVEYKGVIDGDTAYFIIPDVLKSYEESVRFMVVDAPKLYPEEEPLGKEAALFIDNVLKNGKEIYLESDINNNLRDDTLGKRLLAWVWVDGMLLNYLLVKKGFASVRYIINSKMKYLKYLSRAENNNQEKKTH